MHGPLRRAFDFVESVKMPCVFGGCDGWQVRAGRCDDALAIAVELVAHEMTSGTEQERLLR